MFELLDKMLHFGILRDGTVLGILIIAINIAMRLAIPLGFFLVLKWASSRTRMGAMFIWAGLCLAYYWSGFFRSDSDMVSGVSPLQIIAGLFLAGVVIGLFCGAVAFLWQRKKGEKTSAWKEAFGWAIAVGGATTAMPLIF